jgi:hypothetical protein
VTARLVPRPRALETGDVARGPERGTNEVCVLNGGPMDGRLHPVDGEIDELCVVMTDGQQHRYQRTEGRQVLTNGRPAPIFAWTGRLFGPR